MNFSNRAAERLIDAVEKTSDKCGEFYEKVIVTRNKCHTSSAKRLQEFLAHEERLKQLHERLQEDELSIQLIKGLNEKVIKSMVAQVAVSNCLLEYHVQVTPAGVADINTQ